MHKTSGVRDPAAAFPLPGGRDDAADRRAANRAVAVSAADLPVRAAGALGRQVAAAVAGRVPEAGSLTGTSRAAPR